MRIHPRRASTAAGMWYSPPTVILQTVPPGLSPTGRPGARPPAPCSSAIQTPARMDLKNIYSADVFLNNKDGAKITALSPGTVNKKVGVEYGYYPIYYRYWYDDPNDSAGAEEVGWVTTDDEGNAINVILNAGSDTTSFDVPVYYASVGKSGTVYIVNELNQAAQIYADSGLIEDIHQSTGSTSSLSILTDRGGSYTFRIPVGRYNLEAKSLKSGDVLASFSGLDISEKHGAVWVINSSSTGWDIEIANELTMAMALHDAASGDYLGFTLDPAETRTVRIPGSMTAIKALNRFNDMEAEFDGPGSSWTISADNVSRKVEMTVLAPASGSSTSESKPSFRWAAVPWAAKYEVQIADSLIQLNAAPVQETAASNYTPSTALADGQIHYWRVRAVDESGLAGQWSETYSLTVSWGTISDQSPANGASTADTTPALSWSAVSGVARYEVRIAGDENGLAGAAEQQTAGTSYIPSEALANGQTPLLAGAGGGRKWIGGSVERDVLFFSELGKDQRPEPR